MDVVSLLSGGLDSAVATWLAAQEHRVRLCLTCDYSQRAAAREIEAASRVAAALGAPHQVIPLPWVGQVAGDALTSRARPLPELTPEELDTKAAVRSAAAVWVPNRNGLLLNVAGVFAEALGCGGIVVGFNAEEGSTFPDNTPDFMHAAEAAFGFSTQQGLRVLSPTAEMTKKQIVQAGYGAGAPLEFVWSCYEAGPAPCRKCESCLRSQRAFGEA
jgi:7-cyano-7-deazaguanine synthase